MRYVTVKNKGRDATRYFAETDERAIDMALLSGRARDRANLWVAQSFEVDPDLFPHEGHAALELGSVYLATAKVDGEWVTRKQLSGDLKASKVAS